MAGLRCPHGGDWFMKIRCTLKLNYFYRFSFQGAHSLGAATCAPLLFRKARTMWVKATSYCVESGI